MILDKGLYIFQLCTLYCWDTLNWWYIQVDNLEVIQYKIASKSMKESHWYLCIVNMNHKEKDCKDLCIHLLVLEEVGLFNWVWILKYDKEIWDLIGLTWLRITSCKWITNVSIFTITNWTMIIHTTICIQATCPLTRIHAFLIDASFVLWTFRTNNTFRTTTRRWTNICWKAWTDSLIIYFTTLWVWTTRRRLTWIYILLYNR